MIRPSHGLAVFAALFAAGCQRGLEETPPEWEMVQTGMTRKEVIGLIGRNPMRESKEGDLTILIWESRTDILTCQFSADEKLQSAGVKPRS